MKSPHFTTDAHDLLTTMCASTAILDQVHAIVEQQPDGTGNAEVAVRSAICSLFGDTGTKAWFVAEQLFKAYNKSIEEYSSPHNANCEEYWERGLNCPHIPKHEEDRIRDAIKRGDNVHDVIDPGWGQYD